MRITKRQLRRIISESIDSEPFDITEVSPGAADHRGYDYRVEKRVPSDFQGMGGQPLEKVFYNFKIEPDDKAAASGQLPAVPAGMPLKDFIEAGMEGAFPEIYGPNPNPQNAHWDASNLPKAGEDIKEAKMKITKRQLRRIIREEKAKVLAEQKVRRIVRRRLQEDLGSSPTLTLDLGPSGDYPTLGNTATDDTFRVPDFGSSEELMQAVEAALGPVSPDTPVKDYDLGLGTVPLSQLYDKVMDMA